MNKEDLTKKLLCIQSEISQLWKQLDYMLYCIREIETTNHAVMQRLEGFPQPNWEPDSED